MVDRRKARRFRLALPVRFGDDKGITRDMSTTGVFIESATASRVGDKFSMTIEMADTTLKCLGRVVRVEAHENKHGIGVELTSYAFE